MIEKSQPAKAEQRKVKEERGGIGMKFGKKEKNDTKKDMEKRFV